ncbi:response regulator transcription factor [Helcobacillus sp. ACRRO]|uniref:response regulator n=1 Tax=Helcobacillus TaxID=1161125 RepID=UPI001EF537C1|nr:MULTISPECIES: response regulator transcription factor [Helcobacillus]MCG7427093.1 response regulator transcription factor [Helcobacillus sp. ACRRO]MDK7742972.1 response regulator transcription factor [Helcobacillus massiliensis]WOO93394.1 response regulator transcription factor [Helcobacillus massiliensis]
MIRAVVADDQPLMRRALGDLLDASEEVRTVASGADGAEAIDLCREHTPDVALIDLDMPVMNGIDAISVISRELGIRCVAITTFVDMDWVLPALRAGASGYLAKDSSPEFIVDAVTSVMDDTMVLAPSVVELLAHHAVQFPSAPPAPQPGTAPRLTDREMDVIRLLARGLNNREIAADLFLSEGAVKQYLARAYDRLGVRDRLQLLVRAVELGLVTPSLANPDSSRYGA